MSVRNFSYETITTVVRSKLISEGCRGMETRNRTWRDDALALGGAPLSHLLDNLARFDRAVDRQRIDRTFAEPLD